MTERSSWPQPAGYRTTSENSARQDQKAGFS